MGGGLQFPAPRSLPQLDRPDTRYGAQKATIKDLREIDRDERIHHAGLLLIVFNESAGILSKDLELFELLLAQKEVLAGDRQVRSAPTWDRMGHRLCTAALWPTVMREG